MIDFFIVYSGIIVSKIDDLVSEILDVGVIVFGLVVNLDVVVGFVEVVKLF